MDGNAPDSRPGRTCPLSYRYSPLEFKRDPDIFADTLYVVGGLYGNVPALHTLLEMAAREPTPPVIVFNGDFNWFNSDDAGFAAINEQVLQHIALRGNVETELASDDDAAGCGCSYPEEVSDAEVARSNAILCTLRETSRRNANIRKALGGLPMHAVASVADLRIGIVHGDGESLAGWGFSHNRLSAASNLLALERQFAAASVDVFASSHTCLPALRHFNFGTIVNNGAAGMPNFRGASSGLFTRIGKAASPHATQYGCVLKHAHIDAIPLEFDQREWLECFLANWPEGSAGHQSYFQRICEGPEFRPADALDEKRT